MDLYIKYIKYKNKYLTLKNKFELNGGAHLANLDLGSERTTRLLTKLKDAPQGKACQESDVTVWNIWVKLQILRLPDVSVHSYFFLLDDSKLEILRCRQPSQSSLEDPGLTPEDCQYACYILKSARTSKCTAKIKYVI